MARIWQNGFESGVLYNTSSISGSNVAFSNYNLYTASKYFGIEADSRGGYGSYSLVIPGHDNATSSNCSYITIDFANKDEIFIRMYVKYAIGSSNSNRACLFRIRNATASETLVDIGAVASSTTSFVLSTRLAGSTTNAHTTEIYFDTWHKIDIHYKLSATDGVYVLKVNNNTVYSFNGNTKGSLTSTTVNRIQIGNLVAAGGNAECLMKTKIDDMAINDTSGDVNNSWVGDSSIIDIRPTANGSLVEFTPSANSNFDNVKERAHDTTTTNTATSSGLTDLFAISDITNVKTTTKVNAINISTYSMADNFYLAHLIKSGDTVTELNTYANNGTWKFDNTLLENDIFGEPITINFVNNMEVGYRSKEIS